MPGELDVQRLRADSLAPQERLQLPAARFPHAIFPRPTSAGLVATFGALDAGLTQVWTSLVACSR